VDTADKFQIDVERNFRFNFLVNIGDVGFYMFGISFISSATILPLYLSHFTHNPIILGLIPFLTTAGFLVPQLFSSNLIERAPVKKFFPFNLGLFLERLPVVLFVPIVIFSATTRPILAVILFLVVYAWHTCGAGFVMVGWQDMIAKIIPVNKRGRFFGLSNFIGNITGLAGASVVTWTLAHFPFPTGFVVAFSCAAACITLSWFLLGLSREPPDPISKPIISTQEYFRKLPEIIRKNRNFRLYLLTLIISSFGAMASGFIAVFAISRWNLGDSRIASFNIALLIGQALAPLLLGLLADRKGHKIVLEIAIVFNILAFILAIASPTPEWFYAVFALRGISMAASFVSSMAFPLEFSSPLDRPTYIGLAGTVPGIAGSVAPILAGVIASTAGYTVLFALSSIIAVLAFITLRWIVKDPRHNQSITNPG
jgi:MFS family permease